MFLLWKWSYEKKNEEEILEIKNKCHWLRCLIGSRDTADMKEGGDGIPKKYYYSVCHWCNHCVIQWWYNNNKGHQKWCQIL